jgi:hypothetical protein
MAIVEASAQTAYGREQDPLLVRRRLTLHKSEYILHAMKETMKYLSEVKLPRPNMQDSLPPVS